MQVFAMLTKVSDVLQYLHIASILALLQRFRSFVLDPKTTLDKYSGR
jgi:hypothetical protein